MTSQLRYSRLPIPNYRGGKRSEKQARAEKAGIREGWRNMQYSNMNFVTGEEWVAWLRGWRRGQRAYERETGRRIR